MSSDESPITSASPPSTADIHVRLNHAGTNHSLVLPSTASLADLSDLIADRLSIPGPNQKLLIKTLPIQKYPFATASASTPSGHTLGSILAARNGDRTKIDGPSDRPLDVRLLVSEPERTAQLDAGAETARQKTAARDAAHAKARRDLAASTSSSSHPSSPASTQYGFSRIAPLPHLPSPHRSLAMLDQLAADAGIRHAMRSHRLSVGLLTELDPVLHTDHAGKTLGLNRNRGEAIELRLRTDAADGYRAYRAVRDTLCHELAHNRHGDHDAEFWRLCVAIEREVARNDGVTGGRTIGGDGARASVSYDPSEAAAAAQEAERRSRRRIGDEGHVHVDGGGWTGRSYVLGGGGEAGRVEAGGSTEAPMRPVLVDGDSAAQRREALARAAEERLKRMGRHR